MGVIRMHRDMKDITLSTAEMDLHAAIQTVNSEEDKVYWNLDLIKTRIIGEEGRELERETRDLFADWKPIRNEVIQLVMEGNNKAASLATKGKVADHVAHLERRMMELSAYAREKADGFTRSANDVQNKVWWYTIIWIGVVGVVSTTAAMGIIRSIMSNVKSLTTTMSHIQSTGSIVKAQLTGRNEITEMAKHFNVLTDRLDDQLWLRDSLNELNRELSGDLTYDELTNRSINFVSRCINACTGALYVCDEQTSICERKASFALVESELFSNRFEPGKGIVGQVAVEKRPIVLNNITASEALGVTGTLSEPPKSIYAVPLTYEEELIGVLEVASFERMSGLKRLLVSESAGIISTFLFTTSQNERIKDLYKSTQVANEKLETRQVELDELNEELVGANEKLQTLSEELQAQADELRTQTEELERRRRRVEEADRLKSEFLSNMSHELRTPLNSVLALSQLMISRGTGKNPDQEQEYLRVIERNGRHLLNLINDILDLSKIESGRVELETVTFDLKNTVERALDTIRPLAEGKGLNLQVRMDGSLKMQTDEERLHQILLNLLSNAVKFTERGEVELSVNESKDMAHVSVRDTGIGISVEDQSRIFDQFRQADGSTTRRFEGSGLGLTISQKLAGMLGGRIAVTSELNTGSTFQLSLPTRLPVETEAEDAPLPSISEPVRPAHAIPPLRPTVLVIDDDPEIRKLLKDYLVENGYEAVMASNGREGLRMARSILPYAITLDVLMPEQDGWEVLRNLKDSEETAHIPVIISSITEDRATGIALGAAEYLVKPVDKHRLLAELERMNRIKKIHRILAVDDDPAVRIFLQHLLEEQSYIVETASGGEEALRKAVANPPDALILDLIMPGLNGFAFLDRLREKSNCRDIPVIVLTSKDLDQNEKAILDRSVHRTMKKGGMDKDMLLNQLGLALGRLEQRRPPAAHLAGPLLLVVEDNETAALQIRTALEESGYAVTVASDGAEALESVKRVVPNGIVLDLMMPKVDGFQVLEQIRSTPRTARLPVLVLTAKELTSDDRKRLLHNNIRELIQKGSLNREELVKCVVRMIDRAPHETAASATSRQPSSTAPDGNILVVEDNPDNMVTATAILSDAGPMNED